MIIIYYLAFPIRIYAVLNFFFCSGINDVRACLVRCIVLYCIGLYWTVLNWIVLYWTVLFLYNHVIGDILY